MLGSSRTIESENHEEEKDFPQEKIFYTKSQNMQEKVYFWSKLKGEICPVADLGILEGTLVLRNFEKATVFCRRLGLPVAMETINLIAEVLSDLRWRMFAWTHFTRNPSSYIHLNASRCCWATGAANFCLFYKLIHGIRIVVRKL